VGGYFDPAYFDAAYFDVDVGVQGITITQAQVDEVITITEA
jgi:hypothetical protein